MGNPYYPSRQKYHISAKRKKLLPGELVVILKENAVGMVVSILRGGVFKVRIHSENEKQAGVRIGYFTPMEVEKLKILPKRTKPTP